MNFAISGFIYIYAGIVIIIVGFVLHNLYHQTNSTTSIRLLKSAFGVGIGEFLFGLPMVIFNPSSFMVKAGYIVAWLPVFLSLNYSLAAALDVHNVNKSIAKFILIIMPFIAIVFSLGQFLNPPAPFLDQYGLIHWNVPFNFAVLSLILLGVFAVYPGFVFALQKISGPELKAKVIILGLGYILASFGGGGIVFFSNSLFDSTFWIFVSTVSYFLGFTLLTILFLFYGKILKKR